jgi:hypothetical protein
MAAACLTDPVAALQRLSRDYIEQTYPSEPGGTPSPRVVSKVFAQGLDAHFGGREHEALSHPRYRLHVFTSHGRHVLAREGRGRTALGYLAAFATNACSRRALGFWLDRVVFSDPRDPLPLPLDDFRSHAARLTPENFQASVLASCSIPFWLRAVQDIPGGPRGAYWDGGITDYHLHLRYDALGGERGKEGVDGQTGTGLALYPHFQRAVVPGWLDKPLRSRHLATPALSRLVLLAPSREWVAGLPRGKLPDRSDFKAFASDLPGRMAIWRRAVAESQRLADEFAEMLAQGAERHVEPL